MLKKLLKPLVILAALLAVWIAVNYTRKDPTRPDMEKALTVHLDPAAISRIEIARGADTVQIRQAGATWEVRTPAGFKPADQQAIASAVGTLNEITTTDIVSHNKEKQTDYQVDLPSGTRVTVYGPAESVLEDLILGKMGGFENQQTAIQQGRINERQFYTFIRRASDDRVFKVQSFFGGLMGTSAEQWRDHNLFRFRPQDAVRVSAVWPEKRYVVEKNPQGAWTLAEPAPPDSMAVDSTRVLQLVNILSSFTASGFVDSTVAAAGFDSPSLTIAVRLADGSEQTVLAGARVPEGQNLFYGAHQGESQLYTLAEFRLDQVRKDPAVLLKKKEQVEGSGL
ncbi:MAG: DUF4340 domain-containing protein [Candidatus Glassbacteria bacterium]